jgi:hypothetical protein
MHSSRTASADLYEVRRRRAGSIADLGAAMGGTAV